jgi:uncharacterized low-complexity protein
MSAFKTLTPVAAALALAMAASVQAADAKSVETMKDAASAVKEGKCGEGKCGAAKAAAAKADVAGPNGEVTAAKADAQGQKAADAVKAAPKVWPVN